MSVLPVGIGSSGGYEITNSVRLRAAASAYFSRTFGAPTNNKKWHYRCLVKRGTLGAVQTLISADAVNDDQFFFNSTDTLRFQVNGTVSGRIETTAVFRDPSAWYDVELIYDSANATSTDRAIIKVNGVRQAVTVTTAITLDYNSHINSAIAHNLGRHIGVANYCDLYKADEFFVDGAITGVFGETNSGGVWVPKAYSGTYGTNGFHLDFKDAALTAGSNVGLGKDVSGNGNYWTTNNISVTAGVTYDSMVDTPTNNYATLNPLDSNAGSLGDAALNFGATVLSTARATQALPLSGKWYWEVYISAVGNQIALGVCGSAQPLNNYPYSSSVGYSYISTSGNAGNNAGSVAYGATFTTADLIGVLYDADAATLSFYKNNSTQGTAFSSLSGTLFPCVGYGSSSGTGAVHINFGQRPFTHTPPTGFKALCTANLPAVAITKPASYFNAKTRTGTGASFNVTGQAFQPDLVWTKGRSGATDHALYDAVRGVQKQLESNTTGAETTEATGLTAFNSDGYSGGALAQMNTNAATYIDWMWKAGNSTGVSNTSGSITSTVSANTTAGFSIVTYTGTGANATVGHGLGVAPKMVIVKKRTSGGIGNTDWNVYHSNLTSAVHYIRLNLTNAEVSNATVWNSTAPTSTVFSLGTQQNSNDSGDQFVAYCFAEIPGYSKFGSYVGNGSADGPFVFCGFRPRYVLIKNSAISSNWYVWDTSRGTYNASTPELYPNLANAEGGTGDLDFTANGFKLRNSADAGINGSTNTFIFAAFAEHPFGGSNVSPSPAR